MGGVGVGWQLEGNMVASRLYLQVRMRETRAIEDSRLGMAARITRGHSDLPREESRSPSLSSSGSEEQEESVPKVKKIHHMTIRAMERRRLLEEMAQLAGTPLQPKEEVPKVPRKRGRPKGWKKQQQDKQDYLLPQLEQPTPDKQEAILRKRDVSRHFVEESQEIRERQEEHPLSPLLPILLPPPPPAPAPPVPLPAQQPPPVHIPNKRGRKKKVQPAPSPPVPTNTTSEAKPQALPRSQAYENYQKHYQRIVEQTREKEGQEVALIFNKIDEPQLYQELLDHVNCDLF